MVIARTFSNLHQTKIRRSVFDGAGGSVSPPVIKSGGGVDRYGKKIK